MTNSSQINTTGPIRFIKGVQIDGRLQSVETKPKERTFIEIVNDIADEFDEAFRALVD